MILGEDLTYIFNCYMMEVDGLRAVLKTKKFIGLNNFITESIQ